MHDPTYNNGPTRAAETGEKEKNRFRKKCMPEQTNLRHTVFHTCAPSAGSYCCCYYSLFFLQFYNNMRFASVDECDMQHCIVHGFLNSFIYVQCILSYIFLSFWAVFEFVADAFRFNAINNHEPMNPYATVLLFSSNQKFFFILHVMKVFL